MELQQAKERQAEKIRRRIADLGRDRDAKTYRSNNSVATEAKISRAMMSYFLSGHKNLSLETMDRLSKILKIR